MPKSPSDYRALLDSGRWFQELTPAFADRLLAVSVLREFPAEAHVFARGDAPDGFYGLVQGTLRICGVGEGGKEAVLAVVEPPQWFGEIAVFDGLPRTHDGVTVTDAVVLHVPQTPLVAMLAEHPEWWRELGLLVTTKLRLAFLLMEDMTLLPLVPRVARRLALMAEGHGVWEGRSQRVVRAPQEVLAAMVSASRQTTNQALKQLEARGLIKVAYGEVEILDLEGLRAAADGGR